MSRRDPTPAAVLPVGLLLEGRPCLVVGGGKIAARKVRLLLEAGADVTVVSPEVHTELAELVAGGRVRHHARDFAPGDIAGQFLVFAATSFEPVNRQVLEECRPHNILACAVDASWRHGRFLTPATFRTRDVAISVTTGGRSCRQARIIKDNLARHMDLLAAAQLLVLGTCHAQLSDADRARVQLTGRLYPETGAMLREVWGLHEFILLNAGDRLELIALAAPEAGLPALLQRILRLDQLPAPAHFALTGWAAFEHLGLLAAGLLAQAPGGCDLAAPLQDALRVATEAGWAGSFMDGWVGSALHMAQHIRDLRDGVELDGRTAAERHGNGALARRLEAARAEVAGHRDMYDKLVGDLQGGHAG